MPRNVPTSAAATFLPISSGGPPRALIVITTPSTAATIPRPGSESATVPSAPTDCSDSCCVHLDIGFHHLVDVEGLDAAHQRHAHGVADEVAGQLILGGLGKGGEELALLGLFNVVLYRVRALAADFVEHLVQHLQRIEIALLAELRALQHLSTPCTIP